MKKVLTLVLSVITVLSLCLAFAACNTDSGNANPVSKLESENVVAEGKFDEGVSLSAAKIEAENEKYAEVIAKIADKDYEKENVVAPMPSWQG